MSGLSSAYYIDEKGKLFLIVSATIIHLLRITGMRSTTEV